MNCHTKMRWLVSVAAVGLVLMGAWPIDAANLMHRFDFENETGEDTVGGLEGVLIGDPSFVDDAPSGNRAIVLEGDQYVRVDDEVDFGAEFSFAMWVLPDSSALGIQTLIANAPGGWDTDGFKLYYNTWSDPATADGAYILETGDGVNFGLPGDAVRSDVNTIVDEEWTHVGATVDIENADVWFYLNGEPLVTSGGLNFDMKTDGPFDIGNMLNDWDLHGMMDDVQIYDGILTEEEMKFLYDNPGSAIGFEPSIPGDFNGNGELDAEDIDDLTQQVLAATNDVTYDLNADNLVNQEDRRVWVEELVPSWFGDANLDGEFSSADLVEVLASGTYETNVASGWASGDFNGDGQTNSGDLVTALAGGGYEVGPRAAVAVVPEPTGFVGLAVWGTLALLRQRRR